MFQIFLIIYKLINFLNIAIYYIFQNKIFFILKFLENFYLIRINIS